MFLRYDSRLFPLTLNFSVSQPIFLASILSVPTLISNTVQLMRKISSNFKYFQIRKFSNSFWFACASLRRWPTNTCKCSGDFRDVFPANGTTTNTFYCHRRSVFLAVIFLHPLFKQVKMLAKAKLLLINSVSITAGDDVFKSQVSYDRVIFLISL